MAIAYLILTHNDPNHLSKLIKALGHDCDIYIHIDKKSDFSRFVTMTNKINVNFLSRRIPVSWASISMIDAQNLLIKAALKSKKLYTHVVFLSGSCYPIKKSDKIHKVITENPKREFIKYIDMRESPDHYMKQINKKWFQEPFLKKENGIFSLVLNKVFRNIINRINFTNRWNNKIIPYCGSQWCALTIDCCQYIIDFQNQNPWYRQMNKYTFSPDEHYYHTIIGNSKYAEMANGLQKFKGHGTWRMANLHIIDESLSKWFTLDDWKTIIDSDKLFVRKVNSKSGSTLVNHIDNAILM